MTVARTDVLVVGGGPAGSTAACLLARHGLSVLLCERERFPRFHIGESLLPYTSRLWRRLGIYGQLEEAGFQPKWGARFYFEPGEGCTHLDFEKSLDRGARQAFNVRRADFDHLLLKNAAAAGVKVLEGHEIDELHRDGQRIVGARAKNRTLLQGAGVSAFAGKVFERDPRVGLFDLAFFSRAALNRKADRKEGRLPPAPACDVTEPERLCRSLPFGKIGCAPAPTESHRTLK